MSTDFAARLTRMPLVHDAGTAREVAAEFASLGQPMADLLSAAASASPYLRSLMTREADWLRAALPGDPDATLAALLNALDAALATLPATLRTAKRRVALLVAMADLGGVWTLDRVTAALTALADRAVHLTVTTLVAEEIRRGRLPGQTPGDAGTAGGLSVIAMGKMGAHELNYSSDIDLICLFDETRYPGDAAEARRVFIRVTRAMTAILSDVTAGGYVFRTDLRLRPDASVTPVCLSMAAAESYYEAEGRTWERSAWIKARPCGGDLLAGARFVKALTPFVWRKHLDFAAIEDAHDIRLRIRDHRRLNGPIRVEGHDLKLGQGGIREIEFFTQTRQLIAGGRDVTLRHSGTVPALASLAAAGWVPQSVASELTEAYDAHRMLEHRLQMVNDAQTHQMPQTDADIARIACLCGMRDVPAFRAELLDRLACVQALTEGFFTPARPLAAATGTAPHPPLSDRAAQIVAGWPRHAALRSDRAQAIFLRLRPLLLARLMASAQPDEALAAFDGFLGGLPAGVQILSLFEANPPLVDLIVDIAATSPDLARYLARNAGVLDAVIGGDFFVPWPGEAALARALTLRLSAMEDYEHALDAARRWMKEWHFRIGVHHLRGLIDAQDAGAQYADLAGAVVSALWPRVVTAFAARHGPAPGVAVVLGMGSLGAGRLHAGSDLDLIVIHDAGESDAGGRLAPRAWFSRLTQAFVTALSVPMAEGRLYAVDMRLRPSGRQGPVATSWAAWRNYQETEAWTWEHLALTRARVLAGDTRLAGQVEAFRRAMLTAKSNAPQVRADVAAMLARLGAQRPGHGVWDARHGPGRLLQIELAAQTCALLTADPARAVAGQIAAGREGGLLSGGDADSLEGAADLLWRLHAATRLLTDGMLDPAGLGAGARALFLRETGMPAMEALETALRGEAARAHAIIARLTQLPSGRRGAAGSDDGAWPTEPDRAIVDGPGQGGPGAPPPPAGAVRASGDATAPTETAAASEERHVPMPTSETDPKGLVRESYAIEGISPAECRSIFLDWALSLAEGASSGDAARALIAHYGARHPGHPMTQVLSEGLTPPPPPGRKGGRAARLGRGADQGRG